jgi:hypothetical protein
MRCPKCNSDRAERYTHHGIDCPDCGYDGRDPQVAIPLSKKQKESEALFRELVKEWKQKKARERIAAHPTATQNVSEDPRVPIYRDTISDDFLRGIRDKPKS